MPKASIPSTSFASPAFPGETMLMPKDSREPSKPPFRDVDIDVAPVVLPSTPHADQGVLSARWAVAAWTDGLSTP
jgi:hypothetical protein